MARPYKNRTEAGRVLASKLANYAGSPDTIVLGLPRGGVPVAYEVAAALSLPLDVFIVRKLGVPGHEELALGAIASGGIRVINHEIVASMGITTKEIEEIVAEEIIELERRERIYRGDRPTLHLQGQRVILVDDGLATGATMKAAVEAVRQQQPKQIIVAVPVGAPETCDFFQILADDVICAMSPDVFYAVGFWYEDFSQTSDDEVRELLERAAHPTAT